MRPARFCLLVLVRQEARRRMPCHGSDCGLSGLITCDVDAEIPYRKEER